MEPVSKPEPSLGIQENTRSASHPQQWIMAIMCRNIRTLFNFDPPATDEEIRAASLQFVRKLSGFNAPSRANEAAFNAALEDVAAIARRLIDSLQTSAPPKNREEEATRARARVAERFGT